MRPFTLDAVEKFVIQGGAPLSGEIVAAGNKNAALPILAACLLTEEELVIRNVPRIRDVESMLLAARGPRREGRVDRRQRGPAAGRLGQRHRRGRGPREQDPRLLPGRRARCSRASAGPRCRRPAATRSAAAASTRTWTPSATWAPIVGGDPPIELSAPRERAEGDPDLHGRALGDGHGERADGRRPDGRARRRSPTPPREPHVQDLARLLTKMGAQVDGIGSNVMTVNGRDKLGGAEHDVCPDHIEIASFMALAAATGGELRIRETDPRRPRGHPPPLPPARPAVDGRGPRPAGAAGAEADRSATTRATRSPRSTTAPGPPSRPTSPRSRWRSRPRPTARS